MTEYRIVAGTCTCGRQHRSDFPEDVSAPVQYGPGVSAFAVYMTQYQLLPFERTAAVLDELAGIAISPGRIYSAVQTAAAHVQAPVAAIREALVGAPLAHADETGMRPEPIRTGSLSALSVAVSPGDYVRRTRSQSYVPPAYAPISSN